MVSINGDMKDEKNLAEALKGKYGTERLSNKVECFYMGRFLYFEGFFDGTQNVIEIPKIPKIPIILVILVIPVIPVILMIRAMLHRPQLPQPTQAGFVLFTRRELTD